MARGAKNIRRRGKTKVTRRATVRTKRIFGNQAIAKVWDVHTTTRRNIKALGLDVNVNDTKSIRKAITGRLASTAAKFADVRLVRSMLEGRSKRPEDFVSEEETRYLQRLMDKHGDNYKAMERDIKLNNMQKTATHLEGRIARLLRYRAALSAADRGDGAGAGAGAGSDGGDAGAAPGTRDDDPGDAPSASESE